MNIFNGRDNYGPIIDVMDLPDGSTEKINKHAIYRLMNPGYIIGDSPCGYYKVTAYQRAFTDAGLINPDTGVVYYTPEQIIQGITVLHDTTFKSATLDDDGNAATMTLGIDMNGDYVYRPGIKTTLEELNDDNSVVVDHYIYDVNHWISIGNAIAYVETLPETTEPIAATKVFVKYTVDGGGGGGGAYIIEGVYILDKKNGLWTDLFKNRVIMVEKSIYETITPQTDILYVVV